MLLDNSAEDMLSNFPNKATAPICKIPSNPNKSITPTKRKMAMFNSPLSQEKRMKIDCGNHQQNESCHSNSFETKTFYSNRTYLSPLERKNLKSPTVSDCSQSVKKRALSNKPHKSRKQETGLNKSKSLKCDKNNNGMKTVVVLEAEKRNVSPNKKVGRKKFFNRSPDKSAKSSHGMTLNMGRSLHIKFKSVRSPRKLNKCDINKAVTDLSQDVEYKDVEAAVAAVINGKSPSKRVRRSPRKLPKSTDTVVISSNDNNHIAEESDGMLNGDVAPEMKTVHEEQRAKSSSVKIPRLSPGKKKNLTTDVTAQARNDSQLQNEAHDELDDITETISLRRSPRKVLKDSTCESNEMEPTKDVGSAMQEFKPIQRSSSSVKSPDCKKAKHNSEIPYLNGCVDISESMESPKKYSNGLFTELYIGSEYTCNSPESDMFLSATDAGSNSSTPTSKKFLPKTYLTPKHGRALRSPQTSKSREVMKTPKSSTKQQSPKPSPKCRTNAMEQLTLDVGQKEFGATRCPMCNMIYTGRDPQDKIAHSKFHNMFLHTLRFPGWKKEEQLGDFFDGRIIRVLPDGLKNQLQKVEELRQLIDTDLGFPNVGLLNPSHTHFYLFVSSDEKKIVGCVIAESISQAFKVFQGDTTGNSKLWCRSNVAENAVCGVSRIWVVSDHRRKKIASRLLDAVRKNFTYGSVITKQQLAFSDPTPDGREFIAAYTQTASFLVYGGYTRT